MALAQFAAGLVSPARDVAPPPAAKPAAEPVIESRIWPLEVNLAFGQVEGATDLEESQQNKLKSHINQLWLERTSISEIITIAGGLVSSMQGAVHA